MTPQLQTFAKKDAGFLQYCERYNRVASNPDVRDEYYRWVDEQMRQDGMRRAALAEGLDKGRAEGRAEARLEDARNFLAMGLSPKQVAQGTGLPLADVKALQ
jgi:predicted transposase/invertase (TIGR01784 family)